MAAASKSKIINAKVNLYKHVIAELFPEDTSDVEFLFNEGGKVQTVRAHTAFLTLISPVFKSMFNGNWKENEKNVTIADANYDDFEAFMQCLYGTEIEINQDNVEALLYLSHKYNIDDISNNCSAFMIQQLSDEKVLNGLNIAIIYDLAALQAACEKLVSENTAAILELPEFLECNINTLTAILKLEKTSCAEVKIFDNCMNWAKQRCHEKELEESGENIRNELGDCFSLIRFKEMKNEELVKRCEVYNEGLFSGNQVCELMVYFHSGKLIAEKRYQEPEKTKVEEIGYGFRKTRTREIEDSAECKIQFSTSKPLVLTRIRYTGVFLQMTDELKPVPAVHKIRITKDDADLVAWTYNGDLSSGLFGYNLTKKLPIIKGKYEVILSMEAKENAGRRYVQEYDIKGQTKANVDLVIHENSTGGNKKHFHLIQALTFQKLDENNLHFLKY